MQNDSFIIQAKEEYSQNYFLNMMNAKKKMVEYKLYISKKAKSPDYLSKMIHRNMHNQQYLQNIEKQNTLETIKAPVKRQLKDKRIKKILQAPKQNQVSDAVVCKQKSWVSPIAEQSKKNMLPFHGIQITKNKEKAEQRRQNVDKILKVLDINKKMRFFGEFLETDFDGRQRQIINQARVNKQSKLSYLSKKYQKLDKGQKSKLCILGQVKKHQLTFGGNLFHNPLAKDEFYVKMMRRKQDDLMNLLIESLSTNGHFSLTSYIKFYDIFVWQQAPKKQLQEFVCSLLMGQNKTKLINQISERIRFICAKINLAEVSQTLQDFEEVVKKLIFAEDYSYAQHQKYYLTRQALIGSLKRNQECISIFINVFYDD